MGENSLQSNRNSALGQAQSVSDTISEFKNSVSSIYETISTGIDIALVINDITQLTKGVEGFTAATNFGTMAQNLLNSAILKNPYAMAGAAIATLATGIISYTDSQTSASEQIVEDINAMNEAYEQSVIAIDKAQRVEEIKAEKTNYLKNELFDLEAQIKSGTLTEEEATVAKENFSGVAAQLENIIPGITNYLYDENGAISIQEEAVNDLVDAYYRLAVAKSMIKAYEQKLDEIAVKIVEAEEKQMEAAIPASQSLQRQTQKNIEWNENMDSGTLTGVLKAMTYDAFGRPFVEYTADKNLEAYGKAEDYYENLLKKQEANREKLTPLYSEVLTLENQIADSVNNTTNAIISGNATRTANTMQSYKTQSDYHKELQKEELRNLKYQKEMGEITEEQYYERLAEYRDKYFTKSDAEWQDFTLEIHRYHEKMREDAEREYEKMCDEAEKEIEELADKHKSIVDNLSSENQTVQTLTFNWGDGETETFTELADVSGENAKLEEYITLLDELEAKRGSKLPDRVKAQLADMKPDEALTYVKALLNTPEDEFLRRMTLLDENERLAGEAASRLIDDDLTELTNDIKDKFGEIPADFFNIGAESASQYSAGFLEALKTAFAQVQTELSASVTALLSEGRGPIASSSNSNNSNVYNDNSVTNISTSGSSPRETIEQLVQNTIYRFHKNPFGGELKYSHT